MPARSYALFLGFLALLFAVNAPVHAAGFDAANASTRVVVAVLPFDYEGVEPDQAVQASRRIQLELAALDKFFVVESARAEEFMKELAFQQEACEGIACAQRAGKAFGANRVIIGKLARPNGTAWRLTAELIDVPSGEKDATVSRDDDGSFESMLRSAPGIVAVDMAEGIGQRAPRRAGATWLEDALAAPRGGFRPRNGFAAYTGYSHFSGTMTLADGSGIDFVGGAFGTLGAEYQWALGGPWTAATFAQWGAYSKMSGPFDKDFNMAGVSFGGLELRHWNERFYVGANVGVGSTCFSYASNKSVRQTRFCMNSSAVGPTAGYQHESGVFVSGSFEQVTLGGTKSTRDPHVPQVVSGSEQDLWINVGYRWGQK